MNIESEVKYISIREHYISSEINEDVSLKIVSTINDINYSDDFWENELKSNGISNSYIRKPIIIYLNTYGGSVYDAFAIYGCIKASKTPVRIVCSGKVMSAGILIMLSSEHRSATEGTTFLIHQVNAGVGGTVSNMKIGLQECERLQNEIYKIISKTTKLTMNELNDKSLNDWYFDVKKARELGLINK